MWLAFQPKICVLSGQPVELKALIRGRHPQRGELSPALFVPLTEQAGLTSALTAWVTDSVITRLSRLRKSCILLPVTINISCGDFARKGVVDSLEKRFVEAKLPTSLLGIGCLEIDRILESPAALQGLEMFKQHGFAIFLDNFNIDYISTSHLQRLPQGMIRLDRMLTSEIFSDTASRIITQSISAMLRELDCTTLLKTWTR